MPSIDPTQWVVAAGYLEKERESALQLARPAWASRFVVLTYTTLFWFRKPDIKADLFGEEHGKVQLRDLLPQLEVSSEKGEHILHIKFAAPTGSEAGIRLRSNNRLDQQAWATAIQRTRDGKFPDQTHALQHATGIHAMGYLEKHRDSLQSINLSHYKRPSWSTRLFVLTRRTLFYFRNSDPNFELFGEERGRFSLQEISLVELSTDGEFRAPLRARFCSQRILTQTQRFWRSN